MIELTTQAWGILLMVGVISFTIGYYVRGQI
jgi:hypothetical protein